MQCGLRRALGLVLLCGTGIFPIGCAIAPKTGSQTMDFCKTDLVDLAKLDAMLILDIRYATPHNFTGKPVYRQARAFLQKKAAMALLRVHVALQRQGFRLKIYDAYRPLSVQKILWAVMPDERYVANPKLGSMHNRGMAVDVTLTDLTGRELPMPTAYDEFSEKAHRDYTDLPAGAIRNRRILEDSMKADGFRGIPTEWWHFDYQGWEHFPVLDIPFDKINLHRGSDP